MPRPRGDRPLALVSAGAPSCIIGGVTDQRDERIASHQVNDLLDGLSELLKETAADLSVDDEGMAYLRRARAVVNELRGRLKATRADLIPLTVLDAAAPHLQNARTELDAFVGNRNVAHLANMDTHIDNLLAQMAPLLRLPFGKESEAAVKAGKDYRSQLGELGSAARRDLDGLRENEAQLAQSVDAVRASLEGVKQAADQTVEEVRAELDAKLAELRVEIDSQKSRLDDAISRQQDSFSEAQERRVQEFAAGQKEYETTFKKQADRLIKDTGARLEQLDIAAQASLEFMKEQENRAREVLGITAATAAAGAYVEDADQQRKEADRWRRFALSIFVVLLGISSIAILADPIGTDASAAEIVTYVAPRLPIGIGLLATFYASRQSAHHRERERIARRLAVELTTFRPFIAELPEDQLRSEIREATRRYFRGVQLPGRDNEASADRDDN